MKRVLVILGFVPLGLFVLGILIFVLSNSLSAYGPPRWILGMEFIFVGLFLLAFLHSCFQIPRKRWIKREAASWLHRRSIPLNARRPRWHATLRRRMLWTPVLFVLAIFLFFPEFAGLASHLAHGRSVALGRYRLKMPLTAFAAYTSDLHLSVLMGTGIARAGIRSYYYDEVPLSSLFFYSVPDSDFGRPWGDDPRSGYQTVSSRTLRFGDDMLTCWRVVPISPWRSAYGPGVIHVVCATPNADFHADFTGPSEHSAAFYKILQNAAQTY